MIYPGINIKRRGPVGKEKDAPTQQPLVWLFEAKPRFMTKKNKVQKQRKGRAVTHPSSWTSPSYMEHTLHPCQRTTTLTKPKREKRT